MINALPETLRANLMEFQTSLGKYRARLGAIDRHHPAETAAGRSIIGVLESWLLDDEQKKLLQLNHWDVFLLHAAAYVCDITSVISLYPDNLSKLPDNEIDPGKRNRHDKANPSTKSEILAHWKQWKIPNRFAAEVLSNICELVDLDIGEADFPTFGEYLVLDGQEVNVPLLSAAVRLARDLNPHAYQTALQIYEGLPANEKPTSQRYSDAITVKYAGPHPHTPGAILMRIECSDPELHRALKHHERRVQKRLAGYNRHASPRFLYSDVIFEVEANGYTPTDMRFSVDTSAALRLLTGNRLYADNRVFLRELIQNAVDACNLRKRLESDYAPQISIRFNQDITIVTIRDNGIGMDRQWIEKYFLTIGISLYQSSEIRSKEGRSKIDFNFISQFGIGFLSSFLVAEKIVIHTRKPGHPGLAITITNLEDYFDVRPLQDDFDPGTQVALHLKPSKSNYCRSLEYAGYLKTNIRFLNVPVSFEDQNGKIAIIGGDQLSYTDPKSSDIDFIASLEFKQSEGYVMMRAKKNVDHIFSIDTARGGVAVFQDGIFVAQLDTLLPEGARQHVIGRINLMGEDKCALSMDRNRIFWTDKQLSGIKKLLRIGLAKAAGSFLDALDDQRVSAQTRQSVINQLAIFFDFNEVDDKVHKLLRQPIQKIVEKRFRDFLRIHFAHTFRSEGIPEADGYGHHWQQRIIHSFRKR